jgi:hypothetical protein
MTRKAPLGTHSTKDSYRNCLIEIGSFLVKATSFSEKTARNRHFIETLQLECDIRMLEKLFN